MKDCAPMGASPTPLSADLASEARPGVVAVAYSGGRDSTALLHATWRAACALAEAGYEAPQVVALHVHHGLSEHADEWLFHCESQCSAWSTQRGHLRFRSTRLMSQPSKGDSLEAWARSERYGALTRMAHEEGASLVLLAHHRRDQAETFLLQALRGAGPAGLSAMSALEVDEQGLAWCRPWLRHSREVIEAYVRAHQLSFIEDDSNSNLRFARNRLRLNVWPAWVDAFPEAEAALVQATQRAQEARACLDELAAIDLALLAPNSQAAFSLRPWLGLSRPRRANALHAWLLRVPGLRITRNLLDRLLNELGAGGEAPARWPCGSGELRRYRGELTFSPQAHSEASAPQIPALQLAVPDLGDYEVPQWGGCLRVFPVSSGGLAWVPGMVLTLQARQGAERFQFALQWPARLLRKQFQSANVPAWGRSGLLVFAGDALVFVPGLGLDARAMAPPGVPQVGLAWDEISRREAV